MDWLLDQVQYWYGNVYGLILLNKWKELAKMLKTSEYYSHISECLSIHDVNNIKEKYGDYGSYREKINSRMLQDWISRKEFTSDHRFPIFFVDSIGIGVPLISYNRYTYFPENTYSIIWPLDYHVKEAKYGLSDTIPFDKKINQVVFRGVLSGPTKSGIKASRNEIVKLWKNKPWTNLGITGVPDHIPFNDSSVMTPPLSREEQMNYKYILCIEGADISSGFGWVLLSNSVPICPYPFRFETWFFNGLKPWVHFVPIKIDGSDLEDVYNWCESNPDICLKIVSAGKMHMLQMINNDNLEKIKNAVVDLWNLKVQDF